MEHPPGEEAQVDFFQGPADVPRSPGPLASAVDLPHDVVVLEARLRRAAVDSGPRRVSARARACLCSATRCTEGHPTRLCGAPHNLGSVPDRVMWPVRPRKAASNLTATA